MALARPAARLHASPVQVMPLWVCEKGAVVVTTTGKLKAEKTRGMPLD